MTGSSASNVTIADIARIAGVSVATVSRVLNDHPNVAEETRRRVQRCIEETGYERGYVRRQTAKDPTKHITLIARSMDNEYIGAILSGILDQLDLVSYQLVLHLRGTDPIREVDYVRIAQRIGSDGLLIVIPRIQSGDLLDLMSDHIPFVFIDHYADSPNVPCVRATNWQGARDATSYLVSLGHRRIGFVSGIPGLQIAEAREHGYRSTLVKAGIPFAPDLVAPGDFTQPSGYRAGMQLLALDEPPTAIFASSDLMAMGVMEAIYVSGLRVPKDLSVVGFDDLASSAERHPPLTTVRQPLYDMGRMAAQMVTTLVTGQELVSKQIELSTQLIVRASCCEPRSV
jgi:LacI family transcriptional regulator